jgi:hypothetical protein
VGWICAVDLTAAFGGHGADHGERENKSAGFL